MKKVSLLVGLIVLLASGSALAVPTTMNFTGRLTTSAGPVTTMVNLTFSIWGTETGGTTADWIGTYNGVTPDNGVVYVQLGSGSAPDLDEQIFDGSDKWLEITVGTETLTPRMRIGSVPYAARAFAAQDASTLGGTLTAGQVLTTVQSGAGIDAVQTATHVVQVSLSTSGCADGDVWKYSNGGGWQCQPDSGGVSYSEGPGIDISTGNAIGLSITGCGNNEVWKYLNGNQWSCEPDETGMTYFGSANINVNATSGQISLVTAAGSFCGIGDVLKFDMPTQSFKCQPDSMGPSYTSPNGGGILIEPLNNRITLSTMGCDDGEVLRYSTTTFTWNCEVAMTRPQLEQTLSGGTLVLNGLTVNNSSGASTATITGNALVGGNLDVTGNAKVTGTTLVGLEYPSQSAGMSTSANCSQFGVMNCFQGGVIVQCGAGKQILGGGCTFTPSIPPRDIALARSYPPSSNQWSCEASVFAPGGTPTITAHAICGRLGN